MSIVDDDSISLEARIGLVGLLEDIASAIGGTERVGAEQEGASSGTEQEGDSSDEQEDYGVESADY